MPPLLRVGDLGGDAPPDEGVTEGEGDRDGDAQGDEERERGEGGFTTTFRFGLPPVSHWATCFAKRSEHNVS